jgi:hypothetical protein
VVRNFFSERHKKPSPPPPPPPCKLNGRSLLKTRKMKRNIYKSNLLHELETLNEDNPNMYWKMIMNYKKNRQILIIIIVFPPPYG